MGIKGLDKCISGLTTKFVRIEAAIIAEVQETGEAIKNDAAQLASGIGYFDSSGNWAYIGNRVKGDGINEGNGYRIWVDAGKMGAYREFGTGEYATETLSTYNDDWRKLAYEFYVNGKGKLPATPYMYPSWVKNTTGLMDRLRKRINKPY